MNEPGEIRVLGGSTDREVARKGRLARSLRESGIPDDEILDNLGLYLTRQTWSRIRFIESLYRQIVPVHGVIMEFGVRWGQNMALFSSLRGMLEPYNYNRKIIGFDTFEGFPGVDAKDGDAVGDGDYGVTSDWQERLEEILDFHNASSPIPHKRKYELVVGDASVELPNYLERHPETIISLAYFDFDIYRPTHDCLTAILPHLTQGSILAFDELNCPEFPGETLAVQDVIGLSRFALKRDPGSPLTSYLVVDQPLPGASTAGS
ncbi:MAG: TylF/MycF/NovP-related O-methyltransferase [Longimicrobiales bacterium]